MRLLPALVSFFLAVPFHADHWTRADRVSSLPLMSTPSPHTSAAPSVPTSSPISPFFPVFSSDPVQSSSPARSSAPPLTTPTTSVSATSPPTSSLAPASSIPASIASSSLAASSSSAPSAPVAIAPQSQPPSSSASLTLPSSAGSPTQDASPLVSALASSVSTPSSTPTASPSGFFANTAAVAGTFTVIGLVGFACVIAVALVIARRRHSRSYEDDTEFLDKSPSLPPDPPVRHVASPDGGSSSDHAHYGAPPLTFPTPATVYYPDHAYALHPKAFLPEAHPPPAPYGYPPPSTLDHTARRICSPEDHNIAYFPPGVDPNTSNLHGFTDVHPNPTQALAAFPDALRPSVQSAPSVPQQQAGTRFSVDSFYTGIAKDTQPSSR